MPDARQKYLDRLRAQRPGEPGKLCAQDGLEAWRLIEQLTAGEACTVTIVAGNPDFNGQPNWLVYCNGPWTDWIEQRFADDNRLACLRKALAAKEGA